MTAKQLLEKLEAISVRVIDLDEFTPEQWQGFRAEMGDILRVLGGARKPAVQQARGGLTTAFMQLKQDNPDTFEPFAQHLDNLKKALAGGKSKPTPKPEDDNIESELFDEYLIELGEFIEQLEPAILALEASPTDHECIHSVFRIFHTIKGTAGVMQHTRLSSIAHQTENLLDAVRDGDLALRTGHIQIFLDALDLIRDVHAGLGPDNRSDNHADPDAIAALHSRIEQAMKPEPAPEPEPKSDPEPQPDEPAPKAETPKPESPTVEPEASMQEGPDEPDPFELEDPDSDLQEPPEEQPINAAAHADKTIRLDMTKLDNLIDLVGELVISANLVREDELVQQKANLEFRKKVTQLYNIVGDLQRNSMSLRMIPIGGMLQKMQRVVRDINSSSGKDIRFEVRGKETEIDRNIVDRLYEPLVHLVRNACDHGIETAEERRAAGKSETGEVVISASHMGNNIIIDITDDGRGFDPKAIRAKAIENGILKANDILEDKDVWRLILQPGFTTASKVTDLSGRGVGMDVVNRAVRDLGGHIDASSKPGEGSSFRISMPLTLAILEGMLVRVAGELFVIPVMNVHRIIHPEKDALIEVMGKGELVKDGDALLPLSRLYRIFHLEGAGTTFDDTVQVIVAGLRRTFALMVDELVGIQDVVVKSLGPKFSDLAGVSGSTILGDGSVGLILDINSLLSEDQT